MLQEVMVTKVRVTKVRVTDQRQRQHLEVISLGALACSGTGKSRTKLPFPTYQAGTQYIYFYSTSLQGQPDTQDCPR